MTVGEGRRRGQNDFSLRMSNSFSKRWVCCVVENLSRVFLSEQSLILLWIMRVNIVWMKGKKVTLKILQEKSFTGTPQVDPSRETLAKLTTWHDSSTFSMCFSRALFTGTFTHELLTSQSRNCIDSSFHAQFFTNLILNPIQ